MEVKAKGDDSPFEFLEDSDETSPADDSAFESLSSAALAEASAMDQANDTSQIDDIPDSSYMTIADISNSYPLTSDSDNGNLYVGAAGQGTYFASVDGFIIADDSDNYLHYYTDVMAAYNVSRLRLSDESAIPATADVFGLAPVDYDEDSATPKIYGPIDTMQNVFVTITCDIEGQYSKVFLVRDADEGGEGAATGEAAIHGDWGCSHGLLLFTMGCVGRAFVMVKARSSDLIVLESTLFRWTAWAASNAGAFSLSPVIAEMHLKKKKHHPSDALIHQVSTWVPGAENRWRYIMGFLSFSWLICS